MATITQRKRIKVSVNRDQTTAALRISRVQLQLQTVILLAGLFLSPLLLGYLPNFQLRTQSILISLGVFGCLVAVGRLTKWTLWSATGVYMAVFSLFHFGIFFVFALGITIPDSFANTINHWFYTAITEQAMQVSFIGLLALLTGASLGFLFFSTSSSGTLTIKDEVREAYHNSAFTLVGFGLTFIGIARWFWLIISSGGIQLLVGSYHDYLELAAPSGSTWFIYYSIGLGVPLLIMTYPSKVRTFGIILVGIWGLFAFPLGLRGEILFPLTVSVVILAKQGKIRSPIKGLLAAVFLLAIVAFARELRRYGLAEYTFNQILFSPAEGLLELGSSLRPVVEVVRWSMNGEPFIYGASYWAPFERTLARAIPILGIERLPASEDLRLLNVMIQQRVAPIGFSPVAEAFYNFGVWGVIGYMFLIGLLFSWFDTRPVSVRHLAIFIAIAVPLIIQIRNDFTAVPAQVTLGLVIVLGCLFWSNARYQKRRRRNRSRTG
jgi:oligosaccharide repeat unit polymerase